MIDFESALIFFDCTRCNGNFSQFPGGFCEDCNNAGEWPYYLGTLFANIAAAGALQAMFNAGHKRGYWECPGDQTEESLDWDHIEANTWRPNVTGKALGREGE